MKDNFPDTEPQQFKQDKKERDYWLKVAQKLAIQYRELRAAILSRPHAIGGDDGTVCTWSGVKELEDCTAENCIWVRCSDECRTAV